MAAWLFLIICVCVTATTSNEFAVRSSSSVVRTTSSFLIHWTSPEPLASDAYLVQLSPYNRKDKVTDTPVWKQLLPSGQTAGFIELIAPSTQGLYKIQLLSIAGKVLASSEEVLAMDCAPAGQTTSPIKHLVFVILENHSFDTVFGPYCTAPTGSNPVCNNGPSCCETMPLTDPGTGIAPATLNNAANGVFDPDHAQACEVLEINNGLMNQFVAGAGAGCSSPTNYVKPTSTAYSTWWNYASKFALADRYFQPIAGATSSNKVYVARAEYMFTDNAWRPALAYGITCNQGNQMEFTYPNIGDMMIACNISWYTAAGGYDAMKTACPDPKATGCCPPHDPNCGCSSLTYPCSYDPSDVPFNYWATMRDNPNYIVDLNATFYNAVANGTLPSFVYLQPIGYQTEHPGCGTTLSASQNLVTGIVNAINNSSYANNTLILVTWDEGGGYFDHVPPPPNSTIDGQPYGTRVPLIAIGPFAKNNYISHVEMEHSSIPVFIEWNWFGGVTGQLQTRDTIANNILDLLQGI